MNGVFRADRWLLWVMGMLVVFYFVGLLLHGDGPNLIVNVWLGLLTEWVPVAVIWVAVYRTGFRRLDVLFVGAAVTSWVFADTYYVLAMNNGANLSFPSLADVGYLLFYPLMLAALVVRVRRQTEKLAGPVVWPVVLDTVVGLLGAAAVLTAILSPVFNDALAGPTSLATVVAVAYPLSDLILVAVLAGIAASPSLKVGRRWIILILGLVTFAGADVVYALLEHDGQYRVGIPSDVGWAIGLALIALWADGLSRPYDTLTHPEKKIPALVVPAIAVVAALGILILGTQVTQSELTLFLARATVGLALVPVIFSRRRLYRQSRTDELTGLLNRRALYSDAPARLVVGRCPKTSRRQSALMMLDLDRFKEVNDGMGHKVGDRLLVEVSRRLSQNLRQGDLLARLGGDEFAILLWGSGEEEAVKLAIRLRGALAEPFTLEGITLQTSASFGIALFPSQSLDLSGLLRRADMAMYKAKVTRSGHHVFKHDDDSHGDSRLRTLQELRVALLENQLVLHYQPKISFKTGDVIGVEALVRWNHPTRGLLRPEAFIPLVEEGGLTHDMTQVVLENALDQAAVWQARGCALAVAVNISVRSLTDAGLPERVSTMLAARGLPGSALTLEITGDFLMSDWQRTRNNLTRLHDLGIQIAVDNFGMGYSSLSHLRDLPIDELKLDRSFVIPMADDAWAAALVASTIALAHSLDLRMVAGGVENTVTYDELVRFGCDYAQGFFISHPIPAVELDHWLATRESYRPG